MKFKNMIGLFFYPLIRYRNHSSPFLTDWLIEIANNSATNSIKTALLFIDYFYLLIRLQYYWQIILLN